MRHTITGLAAFFALVLIVAFGGCRPSGTPEQAGPPAPSSGITRELAQALAADSARMIGGRLANFTPTGSMLPVLDSRCVGVLEHAPFDFLSPGDIVGWEDDAGRIIMHRIQSIRDGYAYIVGDNARADGWVELPRIRYRLVAVYYTLRA